MRFPPPRPSPSLFTAILAGGLALLLASPEALADFFGGDLPLLSTLVTQGAQEVSTASQALLALRDGVTSTQRLVGFATQAQNLFTHFSSARVGDFGADAFGLAHGTLPVSDSSRLRSGVAAWAPATGELRSVTRECASDVTSGASACRQVHDALSPTEAQSALRHTFGPALHPDTLAGDYEVARALSAADTHQQQEGSRAAVSAASRRAACASGGDASVCGLAQTARQESQLDSLNEQLAEGNRLQAVGLALQNAERKRALGEAEERRTVVAAGWKTLRPSAVVVSADGVSLLGSER
jgi:hypothetical protein